MFDLAEALECPMDSDEIVKVTLAKISLKYEIIRSYIKLKMTYDLEPSTIKI